MRSPPFSVFFERKVTGPRSGRPTTPGTGKDLCYPANVPARPAYCKRTNKSGSELLGNVARRACEARTRAVRSDLHSQVADSPAGTSSPGAVVTICNRRPGWRHLLENDASHREDTMRIFRAVAVITLCLGLSAPVGATVIHDES